MRTLVEILYMEEIAAVVRISSRCRRVIYKATCFVCATNTRTRCEEYNFPHFPRVFSSAERIHGDDVPSPPAKRSDDVLCMRACIRVVVLILNMVISSKCRIMSTSIANAKRILPVS